MRWSRHTTAPGAGHSVLGTLVVAFVAAGCGQAQTEMPPPHVSSAAVTDIAPPPPGSAAPSAPPSEAIAPWIEMVRLARYADAKALLEAEPPSTLERPSVRFLRARLASETGDHQAAVTLLTGLEFPVLSREIEALRAASALVVGPYDVALAFYQKSSRPRDQVKASRAAAKLGDKKKALTLAEDAVTSAQKTRRLSDERAARDARADALLTLGKDRTADLKWLARSFPSSPEGRAARKELGPKGLSDKDKRAIVDALIDQGPGKDAIAAVDAYSSAFGKADLEHLRAHAHFKARMYQKAASLFEVAAKRDDARHAEHLYYWARSLARSKREDAALARFADVERKHGRSSFAERAAYQRAQLLSSQGRYPEAREAFTRYLSHYAGAKDRTDAEYALALSYLSSGSADKARETFGRMAARAKKTDWGILRQLEGVALLRAGDEKGAVEIFTQVAKDQPLTFGAAMSRARLTSLGAPLPPVITPPPAEPKSPVTVVLPENVRELMAVGLDEDAEAALSESESVVTQAFPGRESEALCAAYATLSRAKRLYKVGSASVGFEELMRAPSDRTRWTWDCVYPRPYEARVREHEKARSLPRGLVFGLMRQESGFDPEIRSPVGAEGLMQLMPTTAELAAKEDGLTDFKPGDVTQPETNLRLGSFYIAKMLKTFDGSLPLAAASYNAGPTAVGRWVETTKELETDVFVARIPYEETRNYVGKVVGNTLRYQWLEGGDAAVTELPLLLPSKVETSDEDY